MIQKIYWVVDIILRNIHFEVLNGVLMISFRRVISYKIQAIDIIPDFRFCVFEMGDDPSR